LLGAQQLPGASRDVMFTDFGPLILYFALVAPGQQRWHVVDLATGEDLFSLPLVGPDANGIERSLVGLGATSDGSLIALQYPTTDGAAKVVTYWTVDGLSLGQWTSPAAAMNIQMSTLGSYLSYELPKGPPVAFNTFNEFDEFVVTLDGDAVATLPGGLWPYPENPQAWVSDGSLVGCIIRFDQPQQRAGRWDLFSPLKPLVASNPNSFCFMAVG
jgi:hypothetical protein